MCINTKPRNWWKCSVVARASARPVLHSSVVPDQVIHMPSWVKRLGVSSEKAQGAKQETLPRTCHRRAWKNRLRIAVAWQAAWPIDKSTTDQEPTPWTATCYIGPGVVRMVSSLDDLLSARSSSWWSLRRRRAPGPIVCGVRSGTAPACRPLLGPFEETRCAITEHLASDID